MSTAFKSKLGSVLFWSVISAAFIGPGTVTTASRSGAGHGTSLLWALVFATMACVVLQEAAARITLQSKYSLGEAIARQTRGRILIFLAIFIGGVAYQGGNILGAIAGLQLIFDIESWKAALMISIPAALLLWLGNYQTISKVLGFVVAIMGFSFLYVATQLPVDLGKILKDALIPSMPLDAEWLVIGLIGTTIVPYNLFLTAGISKGQDIKLMRFGLTVAIVLGGIISMAILIVGTAISGAFSFEALQGAMIAEIGSLGGYLFSIGLFAAGFTSAVTAPLAAAITARSLFAAENIKWEQGKVNYRLTWIIIIIAGLTFSVLNIRPVPAIIMAQAINGILLPVACIYLYIIINDSSIMGKANKTSLIYNLLMLLIVGITISLGLINIVKAIAAISGFNSQIIPLWLIIGTGFALVIPVFIRVWSLRKSETVTEIS